MNSYQKEVAMASLKDEAKILSELEKTYKEARKRIKDYVEDLTSRERSATESELRSIIYQKKYQNALDSQLKTILDDLKNNNYSSVNDYLERSYRNGFMGSMYSLNKQGIPLILPINQEKVVKAITQDTKLSTSFYKKLGINMKSMKTAVRQEISRGISSGMSFGDIARNIDGRMNVGLFNTQRIARTEGHRVNMEAKFDCMKEAENNGAEILKQWDSTLDNRTRPDHVKLDGQIRKLDEPFEVVGADGKVHKAMYPSKFGEPSEDINCRCVVLEIGKWELDEDGKSTKYKRTDEKEGRGKEAVFLTKEELEEINNVPNFAKYKNRWEYYYSKQTEGSLDPFDMDTNPFGSENIPNTWKRIKGVHSYKDDLFNTNPNYNENKFEWNYNCQRCVATYEMRRRGFDVEALPRLRGKDEIAEQWMNYFENQKWEVMYNPNLDVLKKSIETKMTEWGNGSRSEIWIRWKESGESHVFICENHNGTIAFLDPQSNNPYYGSCFERGERTIRISRIDNLKPSKLIGEVAKSRI